MSTTLGNDPVPLAYAAPARKDASERIFFPALNAVRAYAALGVVIWHMRQLMVLFHVPVYEPLYEVLYRCFPRGDDGVMLFFVLSGFLITYLLMVERDKTGTVAVGKFYVRRVLRIWPLYYLLVLVGFVIIPLCVGWVKNPQFLNHDEKFWPRLVLYLLLLPNVAYSLFGGFAPIGHLWSIGVEEQFYLLWPALMKWFGKRVLWVILSVIAVKVAFYYLEGVLAHGRRHWYRGEWTGVMKSALSVIDLLRLDCMAVGGLAAYIAFNATQWGVKRWLYHPISALVALAVLAWSVGTMYRELTPYAGIGHAGIYALFILCVGANPNLPRWLLSAMLPIDYVGRISYGIYMYHVPVIFWLLRVFQKRRVKWHTGFQYVKLKRSITIIVPPNASSARNICLLLLVLTITLAVATVSFYLFERPFLKLKRKYTVIRSGSPETPLAPGPEKR